MVYGLVWPRNFQGPGTPLYCIYPLVNESTVLQAFNIHFTNNCSENKTTPVYYILSDMKEHEMIRKETKKKRNIGCQAHILHILLRGKNEEWYCQP